MQTMAQTESVKLNTEFYKDSVYKVLSFIIAIIIGILSLTSLSIYIHYTKLPPITFKVQDDWRINPETSLLNPYLSLADLLQWVTNVMSQAFVLDFINHDAQVQALKPFFTDNGWQVFNNQLNNYVPVNDLMNNKQFITSTPGGAPNVINQGLIAQKYAWWIQMPLTINYFGANRTYNQNLTFQILVVRVPTVNNINGVAIDNLLVKTNVSAF